MKKKSLYQRLQDKKQAQTWETGVTWYDEHNWAIVKAAAVDPERFEDTYAEWLEMAEKAMTDIRNAGINAAHFYVIADKLLAWCLVQGKPNDASSRAEFISENLRFASQRKSQMRS
jgi:hypothetical protein